jgi:hypothetical protein
MKQQFRRYADIIQLVLSLFIVLLSGYEMIGKPARLVSIIALTGGAIGIGVSIRVYVEKRRSKHRKENIEQKINPAA